MNELVKEINKISLKEGDMLIFKVHLYTSDVQIENLREILNKVKENFSFIIIPEYLDVSLITKAEIERLK